MINKITLLILMLILINPANFTYADSSSQPEMLVLNKNFMQLTVGEEEQNVTKAEIAKLLVDAFGYNPLLSDTDFIDVPKDHPYYREISAAFEHGLISIDAPNQFQPDRELTRSDVALYFTKNLKLVTNDQSIPTIKDVRESMYNWEGIVSVVQRGIMETDLQGYFHPNEKMKMNINSKLIPLGTSKRVVWSSSNKKVAAVDQTGQVTPVSPGIAVISAMTTDESLLATCVVSVVESNRGVQAPETVFQDLKNHWAMVDILDLKMRGLVSGITDHTFLPNSEITRAQFSALILRALGLEGTAVSQNHFSDVEMDKWYAGVVSRAYEEGLVGGFPDGTFKPEAQITRQEMAALLVRAIKKIESNVEASIQDLDKFSDYQNIDNWARKDVAVIVKKGIMSGVPTGEFIPKEGATRAESAVTIKRFIDLLLDYQSEKETTSDILIHFDPELRDVVDGETLKGEDVRPIQLGFTMDEVLQVMGYPDGGVGTTVEEGNESADMVIPETVGFCYGGSCVQFDREGGVVVSIDNSGGNLKLSDVTEPTYEPIYLGATKEQVHKAFGDPTLINSSADPSYAYSYLYPGMSLAFNNDDKLIYFKDLDYRDEVTPQVDDIDYRVLVQAEIDSNIKSISVGSTKDEVISVLGQPVEVWGSTTYLNWLMADTSIISFDDTGRVSYFELYPNFSGPWSNLQ
ncbi:S-layer homology domain-containing protein [Bacillus sp. Marseille-P3661]|uniref:S-layer homology domain-containing protein n=1 Tax=Bacillus sp. Marseille-P3661 TaxID=1936234 RepID=UPI000C81B973|nr:S-layer homology domain-containing protein [Bacillus sp. Marseille-P3661]